MGPTIHENALIALASAASWGGGDFSGGMGAKASGGRVAGAIRFVIVSHVISLVALVGILAGEHAGMTLGHAQKIAILWAIVGGVTGALGLVAFYIALSRGGMGVSAAVSGLLAAAIPALVSSSLEGAPGAMRLAGFLLAGGAIWLIAAGDSPERNFPEGRDAAAGTAGGTMALAVFAGVAFGIYFVAIKLSNPLGLVMPMTIARVTSVALCSAVLVVMALTGEKENCQDELVLSGWGWACGVALLDTGGNVLFLVATRMGRLDVASVLASLYPAGTILLAAWYLHERPTRRQVVGMVAALAAVAMVTL